MPTNLLHCWALCGKTLPYSPLIDFYEIKIYFLLRKSGNKEKNIKMISKYSEGSRDFQTLYSLYKTVAATFSSCVSVLEVRNGQFSVFWLKMLTFEARMI